MLDQVGQMGKPGPGLQDTHCHDGAAPASNAKDFVQRLPLQPHAVKKDRGLFDIHATGGRRLFELRLRQVEGGRGPRLPGNGQTPGVQIGHMHFPRPQRPRALGGKDANRA